MAGSAPDPPPGPGFTIVAASLIGAGAMVGAGVFALLGTAGAVAGAAVWLCFLLAGGIATLQCYSFAKLGATFPSAGGMLDYLARGLGDGHVTGITCWLVFGTNALLTALVAVAFGDYASAVVAHQNPAVAKVFGVLVILAMTALNVRGSTAVAQVQSAIVKVVVAILVFFAAVALINVNPSLLAPAGYPDVRQVVSGVALAFFAFLGLGVISCTARDLPDPSRQLPRAMYLALVVATSVYVAVALGVFGTLTPGQVVASGGTALAEAAKPTLGQLGYVLMVLTALSSTAGAVSSALYPASGVSETLAANGQFPTVMGRSVGRQHASVGLLVQAGAALVLVVLFDLGRIASLGSAVALLVFSLVTVAHLRVRHATGAGLVVLVAALLATLVTMVVFCATTLVQEPVTVASLVLALALSVVLDLLWKHDRDHRSRPTPPQQAAPA